MTRPRAGRGSAILLAAALIGPIGATVGSAQSRRSARDAPPVVPFQGTLAEARSLASDRHVPLLVLVIYEDDAWDPKDHHDQVELIAAVQSDRDLAQPLERALVALACNRVHELETIEVGEGEARRTVKRCPSYHTDSCSVHQRLFEDAYVAWNTDGALVSPYVALLAPDGEIRMRRDDGSSPSGKELRAAIEKAQERAGLGLTAAEHARVLGLCADGRAAAQRKLHGNAWRAWDAVLGVTQNTRYAEEARAGSEAALAGMATVREQARGEVAAGHAVEGYRLLVELQEQAQGTPIERDLAKEVRALETDKAHREAIQAFKREREAAALLAEVETLFAAGDERRARAKLRGLLRRYRDTEAAAQARERWPDGG
jgi:hypothetical protein